MRPQKPLPEGARESLEKLLKEAKSKLEYQRVLCVWLRALFSLSAQQVAQAIGWHMLSVRKLQAEYLRGGELVLKVAKRGGRFRQNMALEEEKAFLSDFERKAGKGGVLVVKEIHAAYQERLARPVALSTTYRMLARHGWRKVAPRPRHPKANPALQGEFKKNSPTSSKKKP